MDYAAPPGKIKNKRFIIFGMLLHIVDGILCLVNCIVAFPEFRYGIVIVEILGTEIGMSTLKSLEIFESLTEFLFNYIWYVRYRLYAICQYMRYYILLSYRF